MKKVEIHIEKKGKSGVSIKLKPVDDKKLIMIANTNRPQYMRFYFYS